MKRCLPFVLLLTLGSAHVAVAEPHYQVGRTVYGCVDPRATLALSGRDGRHHPRGWASSVRQAGRCFLMTPALRLDIITRNAGLALVRRVPPRIGEPPIYVMASDVRTARAPEPGRNRAGAGSPGPRHPEPQGPAPAAVAVPPAAEPMTAPAVVPAAPAVVPPGPPAPTPDATALPSAGPAAPAAPVPAAGLPAEAVVPPPVAAVPAPLASSPDAGASGVAPASPVPQAAAPDTAAPIVAAPATAPTVEPVSPAPNVPAPTATAPVVTTPAAPAPWPPQQTAEASSGSGLGFLIAGLAAALLLAFVAVAWIVARRRRQFARVEKDWPSPTGRVAPEPPIRADPRLFPTPQAFRRHCASELERAGWVTQLAFPGDGSGPDIVCRRAGRILAVRCRLSPNDITSEMVDEAALMGTRQAASVTMLASNAPFSQRARDEAIRHRIHLLRDNELSVFVG